MFTDMKEALEAEALELTPLGSDQSSAASLVVARHACDKDDLADLLGALGLSCAEDDLVRLLPHLAGPDTPTGDSMTVNAFTATAASMLKNGDSPEHVRSTLGLSEGELAEAVKHADLPATTTVPAPDKDDSSTPEAAVPVSDGAAGTDGIEALLAWAGNHPAASIRNRAARVRADLTELAERRAADVAQREAEERVAKAKAELEAAQAQLRQVKSGVRAATAVQDATPLAPAPAAQSGRRSKEELAAIRTWARANGYQVADKGNPAKAVLDAYDAAHRTNDLAEAS
ncbi:histone-like nucleoid-structuring protein Lsr2 [Streptomyces sp. NPDC002132]|uniref:Lsr2 family DNA-binding protein n=1 Tax=unclassified Streptomyces TaxID=2593676 RepID=UPI003324E4D0